MEISNPQTLDHIIEANGDVVRIKIMEIGDWNMDATIGRSITHGLTDVKIRGVHIIIRSDTGAMYDLMGLQIDGFGTVTSSQNGSWELPNNGTFIIRRKDGGLFDHVDFDATAYNRGWVTALYVD